MNSFPRNKNKQSFATRSSFGIFILMKMFLLETGKSKKTYFRQKMNLS